MDVTKAESAPKVRWTIEQVNALGAEKGFLPEEYWPLEYAWGPGGVLVEPRRPQGDPA